MSAGLIIYNVQLVGADRPIRQGWLLTDGPQIAALGQGEPPAQVLDQARRRIDGRGAMLMSGMIDAHVHFRQPGLTHKATIASESRAALAGGVTTFVDMPNCVPPTVTLEALEQKIAIARTDSQAHAAFYIGATADNIDLLLRMPQDLAVGVKLFMGTSTGNMAIGDRRVLSRLFAEYPGLIAIHAEDDATIARNIERMGGRQAVDHMPMAAHAAVRSAEACVRATEAAMELATRYGTRLHICHISTAEECSLLTPGALDNKKITAEASPHHLWWTADDYPRLGSRIKMNPAIKEPRHREAIRSALLDGRIDLVATDHAPHLLSEKAGGPLSALSGAPIVQFALPLLLEFLEPEVVVEKYSTAPAQMLHMPRRGRLAPGCEADLTLVRRVEPYTVDDSQVLSLCGWTPLAGTMLTHRIEATIVAGEIVKV